MDMETNQIVLSRGLPKTGYTTPYTGYDDGYYYAGWWKGLTYGTNRERFTAKLVGTDKILIDNATGLTWARDFTQAGGNNGVAIANWVTALAYCRSLDFAGFKDWRLPNVLELISIVDFARYTIATSLYTDFLGFGDVTSLFSSTTVPADTDYAITLELTGLYLTVLTKKTDAGGGLIAVRGGV